jgi:peptidoglycan/xylan/chitin deacetylase (PgdA/CDA1 family)
MEMERTAESRSRYRAVAHMSVVSLLFHDVYVRDPHESGFRSQAADRYKLSMPDFEAQLDGLANAKVQTPFPATGLASGAVPTAARVALITFDDGGESYYTAAADRLEALGWHGHCFVSTDLIGHRGFLTPAQIREIDARGHLIGSHSASHPFRFSALTMAEMRREWSESRAALEDLLGHEVTIASVPGGYFSRQVAIAAAEAGVRVLFTSEPTTKTSSEDGCTVVGRFTIRQGHAPDMARRFALKSPWTRCGAWAGWNAKALVKPLLGPSYARIADWLLPSRTSANHG